MTGENTQNSQYNYSPKIKVANSTSTVDFMNTSNSFYDMIITIQNKNVAQTMYIYDTEGNAITEQAVVIDNSVKIILKDIKIGKITFTDINVYSIIISYVTKREAKGIPYIDFDYSTGLVSLSGSQKIIAEYIIPSWENGTDYTVSDIGIPMGYSGRLLVGSASFTAGTTATSSVFVSIYMPYISPNNGYASVSLTEGDIYSIYFGEEVSPTLGLASGNINLRTYPLSLFNLPTLSTGLEVYVANPGVTTSGDLRLVLELEKVI